MVLPLNFHEWDLLVSKLLYSAIQNSNWPFVECNVVVHFNVVEVNLMVRVVCTFPQHANVKKML